MRIVVQRVARSSVSVDGKLISETGRGVMVLVGITRDDNSQDILTLARKLVNLRVFSAPPSDDYFQNLFLSPVENSIINGDDNDDEKAASPTVPSSPFPSSGPFYVPETVSGVKTWAKSVMDIGGDIMIVSQFTLAHVMKGNKPDFHLARGTDEARKMFEQFVIQVNNQYDAFIKEKMPQQGKGTNKKPQQPALIATSQQDVTELLPKAHRGKVAVGAFGEHMHISMENDGPVTIILDSNLGEAENEKKKEKERQQQQVAAVAMNDDEEKTKEEQ